MRILAKMSLKEFTRKDNFQLVSHNRKHQRAVQHKQRPQSGTRGDRGVILDTDLASTSSIGGVRRKSMAICCLLLILINILVLSC